MWSFFWGLQVSVFGWRRVHHNMDDHSGGIGQRHRRRSWPIRTPPVQFRSGRVRSRSAHIRSGDGRLLLSASGQSPFWTSFQLWVSVWFCCDQGSRIGELRQRKNDVWALARPARSWFCAKLQPGCIVCPMPLDPSWSLVALLTSALASAVCVCV